MGFDRVEGSATIDSLVGGYDTLVDDCCLVTCSSCEDEDITVHRFLPLEYFNFHGHRKRKPQGYIGRAYRSNTDRYYLDTVRHPIYRRPHPTTALFGH